MDTQRLRTATLGVGVNLPPDAQHPPVRWHTTGNYNHTIE
jgi:hypothetical protein